MTDTPKRIQRKRAKGWRMPPNTVSVTRPGKWGNPFIVGEYASEIGLPKAFVGGLPCGFPYWTSSRPRPGLTLITDSADAVRRYRDYLTKWPKRSIVELRGKNLACYCAPGDPCHADVLLEIANAD